jgi:hypothetical protein
VSIIKEIKNNFNRIKEKKLVVRPESPFLPLLKMK